jgi:hypothetical protein
MEGLDMENVKFEHRLRASKEYSKDYINNLLQEFSNLYVNSSSNNINPAEVAYIQYMKQDIRGVLSITVFDHRNCVRVSQLHFNNQGELISFMQGYIHANRGW